MNEKGLLKYFVAEIDTFFTKNIPTPSIVSHYCSLEACISILESQSLWMSEHGYMNDPSEIRYGLDIIYKAFENHQLYQSSFKEFFEMKINHFYPKEKSQSFNYHSLLTCFIGKQDYLLGYRLYGDNGNGVAINFKTQSIPPEPPKSHLLSLSVIYDSIKQLELINLIFDKCFEILNNDSHHSENIINDLVVIFAYIMPFIKSPDYSTENEWRVCSPHIYCREQKVFTPQELPTKNLVKNFSKPTYNHFKFCLQDIDSIHIGPCRDFHTAKQLIEATLLQSNLNKHFIKIIPSNTAYTNK